MMQHIMVLCTNSISSMVLFDVIALLLLEIQLVYETRLVLEEIQYTAVREELA